MITGRGCTRTWLLVLALVVVGAAGLASGQDNPLARPHERANPLAQPPGGTGGRPAAKLVLPDWVKPGARLLFEAVTSYETSEKVSASGGTMRIEVVALTGDRVLARSSTFTKSLTHGDQVFSGGQGLVYDQSAVVRHDAIWLPAADIAAAKPTTDANANPQVIVDAWPIGNRKYDAVLFVFRTGDTIRRTVFDRGTGLKLNEAFATGPFRREGGKNYGYNRQNQSFLNYQSYRSYELPWAAGKAPAWAATVRKMRYRGTITTQFAGSPPVTQACSLEYTVKERGEGWVTGTVAQVVSAQGIPPDRSESFFAQGPGSYGAYWLDPAELRKIESGRVIDRDPDLGITLRFERAGNVAAVTESSDTGAYAMQWRYSLEDGALVGAALRNRDFHRTGAVELIGRE